MFSNSNLLQLKSTQIKQPLHSQISVQCTNQLYILGFHLRPGVLFAEQVCIEVGHLPVPLISETPHQFPITHVMELLPLLLSFTALLETLDSLQVKNMQMNTCTQ